VDRDKWIAADAAEFIRLIETTKTMRPILPHDQPVERRKDTTYYNRVVKVKVKDGVKDFRVPGTVGGDRIHYDGDVAANTAEMSTVKILLQSVVSDNANFMTLDIKDFYLNTPLTRPEYIKIQVSSIPQAILDRFGLLHTPAQVSCCSKLRKECTVSLKLVCSLSGDSSSTCHPVASCLVQTRRVYFDM